MWAILLAMTNGEVDRAMKLEETLTEEWFQYWQAWLEATKDKR